MNRRAFAVAVLGAVWAGCATVRAPEQLVAVDAYLASAEARELAEAQPGPLRRAQDHRDQAFFALHAGDAERAATHAWVAWLQVRVAENLEAVSQGRAQTGPGAAAPRAALATVPMAYGAAAGAGDGVAPAAGGVAQALREAEDAKLRLLSAGLVPDARWAEAEALLELAARAVARGERARADELARRAAFVFEVVRITRLGGGELAGGAQAGTLTASRFTELARRRATAADTDCGADLDEAERLLRLADARQASADGPAATRFVADADRLLAGCADRERAVVASRVTPLRDAAARALAESGDPAEQARLARGIAEADAALLRGDLAGAEAALRAAQAPVGAAGAADPGLATAAPAPPAASAPDGAPAPSPAAPTGPPRSRIVSNILQPL